MVKLSQKLKPEDQDPARQNLFVFVMLALMAPIAALRLVETQKLQNALRENVREVFLFFSLPNRILFSLKTRSKWYVG